MKILVTGAAGFIGAACSKALLQQGHEVLGIDNLNHYYDPAIKGARLVPLLTHPNFYFEKMDIAEKAKVDEVFLDFQPEHLLHLAAQAGVRYSLDNPEAYVNSNLVGFCHLLEACRHHPVKHFVFASSSSVYGANENFPYKTEQHTDHPVSLYAATKKSNEMLAHSYSHLYALPTTGLRFFTVYGPQGRPDMAPIRFAQRIMRGETIPVYNQGNHKRDFTYIDDIVAGTLAALMHIPQADNKWDSANPNPESSKAPYRIYNIGRGQPMDLMKFIELLEKHLGRKAEIQLLPKQPGDVDATWADVTPLQQATDYRPKVSLDEGIERFAKWFLSQ